MCCKAAAGAANIIRGVCGAVLCRMGAAVGPAMICKPAPSLTQQIRTARKHSVRKTGVVVTT
eukprot:7380877-Prymnesium_polylepis.2